MQLKYLTIILALGQVFGGQQGNGNIIQASMDSVPHPFSASSFLRSTQPKCHANRSPFKLYNDGDVLSYYMRDLDNFAKECQLLPSVRPFFTTINKCFLGQGECVEWADGRYYMLTGVRASFSGDARYWAQLAERDSRNWIVTRRPYTKSIFMIPAHTNTGSLSTGAAGHVGVVEGILPDGRLCISNWNAPSKMRLSLFAVKPHHSMRFIRATRYSQGRS